MAAPSSTYKISPNSSPILIPGISPALGPGTPPTLTGSGTPVRRSPTPTGFHPPTFALPPSVYATILGDPGRPMSRSISATVSKDVPDAELRETMIDVACKTLPPQEVRRIFEDCPKTNYHYHRCGEIPGQQALEWLCQLGVITVNAVTHNIVLDTRTYQFVLIPSGFPLEPYQINVTEYTNTSGSPNPHFQKFIELTSMAGYEAHSRRTDGVSISKRNYFMACFDHLWSALRFVPGHLLLDYIVTENQRHNVIDSELMIDCFEPEVDGVGLSPEFVACFKEVVTIEHEMPTRKYQFDGENALHFLNQNGWLDRYVTKYSEQLKSWVDAVKKKHGDGIPLPRIILEVQRTDVTDAQYFAAIVGAIYLTNMMPDLVVGVDFVGAEHHAHFMEHHDVQYAIIKYLKEQYHFSNVAMHVGELNKFDKAANVATAISKVVETVDPARLGHVACLVRDSDALRTLKTGKIPVVMCLSSNEWMLGIPPEEHPLTLLKDTHARLLFGSDDSAVNNCSISEEYTKVYRMADKTYGWLKQTIMEGLSCTFATAEKQDSLRKLAHAKFEEFEVKTINRLRFDFPNLFKSL